MENNNKLEIKKLVKNYTESKNIIQNIIDNIWGSACKHKLIRGRMISFDIDDNYIYIKWEDSWNYGGHDDGTEDFPIELLWTDFDLYFDNLVIENEKIKYNKQLENKEKERKRELKTLEELKKKYEV